MRRSHLCALLVWAVGIAACGSDRPTSPGPPEAGSGTLLVDAEVSGSEDLGSGVFSTEVSVTIADGAGAPVGDATVSLLHARLGSTNVAPVPGEPGEYFVAIAGYASGYYILHIRRGADSLVNGRVFAPDIHAILYPTTSDTLAQNQPFTVVWSRIYTAAAVEVETRDFGPALTTDAGAPDNGSFQIPASFVARDDQRVRIWRSNTAALNTCLPGSSFEAEIRNAVEPVVVQ